MMKRKKSTGKRIRRSKKKQEFINSVMFFLITILSISGLLTYLWVYNEINITIRENEALRRIRNSIVEENQDLFNNITSLNRVDRITEIARTKLEMVSPPPETLVVFVDEETFRLQNK